MAPSDQPLSKLTPCFINACSGGEALSGAPLPRSKVEVIECWHLSPEQHSALLSDCLLPLAAAHAPAACRGALLSAPAEGDAAAPGAPAAGAACLSPHLRKAAGTSSEAHLAGSAPGTIMH